MQLTGQGGKHSPHPMQYSVNTWCICFDAPMMASTGQACMHLVQPIHAASSISTTWYALSILNLCFVVITLSPQLRTKAYAPGASLARRLAKIQTGSSKYSFHFEFMLCCHHSLTPVAYQSVRAWGFARSTPRQNSNWFEQIFFPF